MVNRRDRVALIYVAQVVGGVVLVILGVVVLGSGTAEGPRERWFETANWADWIGGLLAGGGGLLVVFGVYGLRHG
jgi:uncharacterized membrane protein YdcZ (DUF606 family)